MKNFNFEKQKDLISGIFFCILSVAIFIASCNIETTSSLQYGGSKLIPWIASATMFICSLCLIPKGLANRRDPAYQPKAKERKIWRVGAVLLMLMTYIFLMSGIGFLFATILFLFALIAFMARKDQRNYVRIAILAIVSGIVIYLLFTKGFGLMLPKGNWL